MKFETLKIMNDVDFTQDFDEIRLLKWKIAALQIAIPILEDHFELQQHYMIRYKELKDKLAKLESEK